jgi:hypothetical protein
LLDSVLVWKKIKSNALSIKNKNHKRKKSLVVLTHVTKISEKEHGGFQNTFTIEYPIRIIYAFFGAYYVVNIF